MVKCQTEDQRSVRDNARNEHEPAACESGLCLAPRCKGSRHVRPQCESHKEMSLRSQRVWRIREGFGRATGTKVVTCPRVFHLYCAGTFLQARRQWSASHSIPPLSPRGLRKQRDMICFMILKSVSTVLHLDRWEISVKFCSDICEQTITSLEKIVSDWDQVAEVFSAGFHLKSGVGRLQSEHDQPS